MWVTKLLISPVKKRIFCPKTTKFGPKLAVLVNLGQAMQAYSVPCCGSVGGCGARAVSRKTPIYFIILNILNGCTTSHITPEVEITLNLNLVAGHVSRDCNNSQSF